MRKLIGLLALALVVFAAVYRMRLFVWDPVADVARDGAKVRHARVMINFANDVMIQDESAGQHRLYLVQNWNKVAAAPSAPLTCVQYLGCMTDADQATATPIPVGSRGRRSAFEGVTMTSRLVEFVDEDGALVAVTIH